jgi:transposase, IS5 family
LRDFLAGFFRFDARFKTNRLCWFRHSDWTCDQRQDAAKALPGNPCDGHTLRDILDQTQKLTGCESERGYVDKGYRGHEAQNPRRVLISGQKRGVFGVIKRELRRRSAIAPVIGHLKAEGHLGRCYLKGRAGGAANAILSAVGYNFRRVLAWLWALLRLFPIEILRLLISRSTLIPAS